MNIFARLLSFFRPSPQESLSIHASALPARPDWKRKRAAPSNTPRPGSKPPRLSDDITWTRNIEPRERYRIRYGDDVEDRTIELQKIGEVKGVPYLGVFHDGKFKTLRADRVTAVVEQLTTGHASSIRAWRQVGYHSDLPEFPLKNALHKVPSIANPRRHWTVDLNRYTCTCPEKRIRSGFGYSVGQLGMICPHLAKGIVDNLPADSDWPEEIVLFLRDPRKVHIDNLIR